MSNSLMEKSTSRTAVTCWCRKSIGDHIDTDMFHAFDFDATMLRIATMNLVMHGIAEPDVHYQDTLSQSFEERHP